MRKLAKYTFPIFILLMLFMFASPFSSRSVYAAGKSVTVKPSGKKNGADLGRISKALKKYKVVKLKKGKTYYLSSPIHLRSNRTIDATGATIVVKKSIFVSDLKKAGYANVQNVTIRGGVWKSSKKAGYKGTSIALVHASGITLENMTINHPNYNGHAIELVACQNVQVNGVTIIPRGTPNQSMESMLQIDIATNETYPRFKGTKFANGATCHNVIISNCTVTGNRAIVTGYSTGYGYANNAHTNIQLLNNQLIGTHGEGLFLVNTQDAVVNGNTIISQSDDLSAGKSIGLHYFIAGDIGDTNLTCENNTIKGGRYAFRAYSKGSYSISRLTLTNNRCYCKKGADCAIQADPKGIDNLVEQGNQTFGW